MSGRIVIYGSKSCGDTRRTRGHLDERNIGYEFVDIDNDKAAERQVIAWNNGKRKMPTVEIFDDGRLVSRVAEPSNERLDQLLRSAHMDSGSDQTMRRSKPSHRDENVA